MYGQSMSLMLNTKFKVLLVPEKKIFKGFLPYTGRGAILTRTIKFCTNFVPPSHWGLSWNLVLITQWFLRVTGWATSRGNLSSGVCDQVRLKLVCSADETSYVLKFQTIASRGIKLSRQRKTKALIRLRGCAGWSAPLLFANWSYSRNFKTLASFCGCAGRCVSGLVGNSRRHILSCHGSFLTKPWTSVKYFTSLCPKRYKVAHTYT